MNDSLESSAELRNWYRIRFRPRLARAVELGLADPGRAAALDHDLRALIEADVPAGALTLPELPPDP